MTIHQRLIAARTEISLIKEFEKFGVKIPPKRLFEKLLSSKIIYPTPTTPESFDGERKNYVFADELLQWEQPQPKYSLGQYIASKDGKGKIHKVSKNAFGYVYCIWNQRQDGTIIGNACINESDIGNDKPNRNFHPKEIIISNPAHQ